MKPDVEVSLVVSSTPKAYALTRAKMSGVESLVLPPSPDFVSLHDDLKKRQIDCIFLLGYMKILPEHFVKRWEGKIINLHPSLLPKFKGLHAIEKSYESKEDMGVSVHEVVAELDAGPLVRQQKVISAEELRNSQITLDEAKMRIQKVEHELVREVVIKWMPKKF